jgi:hypothetical protein
MKKSNRTPLIALGIIVALMAAATIWKTSQTQAPSVMGATAPVDGTAATAQSNAGAAGPRLRQPPTPRRDRANAKPLTREQVAQVRKERTARAARAYDMARQQFAAQRVDPTWSAKTEQGLQKLTDNAAFAQMGSQPKDVQIDCKSSLCEIQGQFASDREARDWTQVYMTNVGGVVSMGRVRFYPNPDGTTQVRIYAYK